MNPLRLLRKLMMDLLGFSKTEANGLIILLGLVVLSILIRLYWPESTRPLTDEQSLTEWAEELQQSLSKTKPASVDLPSADKTISGNFDPNSTSMEQMIEIGVPQLISKRIVLYREKGGRFRSAEDIGKIYGVDEQLKNRLMPHISIENESSTRTERLTQRSFEPEKIYTFELNSVASEELQLIRGIGAVLSERIVKYRDRLGGFHSYDQLKEIYGLSEELINEIQNRSTIIADLKPLDINSDSIKVLVRHPYVDYTMARIIINYRKVHGNFERAEDLRGIKVMSDSLYQKISPYLSQ